MTSILFPMYTNDLDWYQKLSVRIHACLLRRKAHISCYGGRLISMRLERSQGRDQKQRDRDQDLQQIGLETSF